MRKWNGRRVPLEEPPKCWDPARCEVRKTHRAFRLAYVKDCALAKHLDDVQMGHAFAIVASSQGALVRPEGQL